MREEIPAPMDQVVFTIPKALRKLFLCERSLLDLLSRAAFETLTRCLRAVLDRKDGVPGFVVAMQTFGSEANFHPHPHGLVSDGLFLRGGRSSRLCSHPRDPRPGRLPEMARWSFLSVFVKEGNR